MLIMLEQTVTSYTFANSIEDGYVSFISFISSGIGCGLTIYYLPIFAFSFTHDEIKGRTSALAEVLTGIFVTTVVFYFLFQNIRPFLVITGNVVLVVSISYSLLVLSGYARDRAHDGKDKIIRRYLILTLLFLPYMILDMRIERIKGLGEKFPYGIFSVPIFLLAVSCLTLYYGYKEFKEIITTNKNEEDKPSDVMGLEENKEKNKKDFYEAYNITKREREIVELLVKGYSYNRISDELVVTLPTVKSHVYNIYQKTGVKSKIELLNLMNTQKSY